MVSRRHPHLVYKLAPADGCRQSLREAAYFMRLKRRGVSFDHLPRFFGIFRSGRYVVTVQERIGDTKSVRVLPLDTVLKTMDAGWTAALQRAWDECRSWLWHNGIAVNDLFEHNFMLRFPHGTDLSRPPESAGYVKLTLVLIDGVGAVSFVPVADYVKNSARKRLRREAEKFVSSVSACSGGRILLHN